jgi:hypothetical protein
MARRGVAAPFTVNDTGTFAGNDINLHSSPQYCARRYKTLGSVAECADASAFGWNRPRPARASTDWLLIKRPANRQTSDFAPPAMMSANRTFHGQPCAASPAARLSRPGPVPSARMCSASSADSTSAARSTSGSSIFFGLAPLVDGISVLRIARRPQAAARSAAPTRANMWGRRAVPRSPVWRYVGERPSQWSWQQFHRSDLKPNAA